MSNRLSLLMLAAVAFVGLAWADTVSAQTTQLRSGAISKFAGAERTDQVCTTSSSSGAAYVDMLGMSRTFTISGTTNRSVVVLFQGSYWSAPPGHWGLIQLTVDGVVNPGPGKSVFLYQYNQDEDGGAPQLESHGFNFQTEPLPPGSHTVKIRWAGIGVGSGLLCIGSRSLIVLY
jgi:hypothetical protein